MNAAAADVLVRPVTMRAAALPRVHVARRNTDIHLLDGGRVLKLFKPHVRASRVDTEHRLAALAHAHGVSTPAVEPRPVLLDDGRRGLLFARADGPTLSELMRASPRRLEPLGAQLARTLTALHAMPPIAGLPAQRPGLRERLARASRVPLRERQQLLALLEAMPQVAPRLCHGNFQPGKLVLARDGAPVLLDWGSACLGDADCDLARTAVILAHPGIGRGGLAGWVERRFAARKQRAFLAALPPRDAPARARFDHWLAINAAVRLEECTGAHQHAALLRLIRQVLAAP